MTVTIPQNLNGLHLLLDLSVSLWICTGRRI